MIDFALTELGLGARTCFGGAWRGAVRLPAEVVVESPLRRLSKTEANSFLPTRVANWRNQNQPISLTQEKDKWGQRKEAWGRENDG